MLSTMAACSVLVSGSIARALYSLYSRLSSQREQEKLCSFFHNFDFQVVLAALKPLLMKRGPGQLRPAWLWGRGFPLSKYNGRQQTAAFLRLSGKCP